MGVLDQAETHLPRLLDTRAGDFLINGFVPVGHKWDELPVAYPTLAEERGCRPVYGMDVPFHPGRAGRAHSCAQERIAAGKSMGLSVGFLCADDGIQWFKSGAAPLDYAASKGVI